MEVILLENIRGLGEVGQIAKVPRGRARNNLLPRKRALVASPENKKYFAQQRAVLEARALEKRQEAEAVMQAITQLAQLTLTVKASKEGKLFGAISAVDIADVLAAQGVTVGKRAIVFSHGPIRYLGEHTVTVQLGETLSVDLALHIVEETA